MRKLDAFRDAVGCTVRFVKNGLTTGDHKSKEHGLGLGADVILGDYRNSSHVVCSALAAGFDAIGIYHNSLVYSYHLGIRGEFAFWAATKEHHGAWTYTGLFVDPREII